MSTHRRLNIIVIGGGIGGLTAAIALRRSGHKVTVYEKASFTHEVGQGITISPNGGRILRSLGLDLQKARMIDFEGTNVVNAKTLESIAPQSSQRELGRNLGIQTKTAYRIDWHHALVELAQSGEGEGHLVTLVTRMGVESWDGASGTVKFENGETASADLIVAADGVKSTAARHILGPDCPELDSSGTIVYRFTLPREKILADPVTKPLLGAGPGMCTFNVDSAARKWLVRYWCRDDGLQNFALYVLRSDEEADRKEDELRFTTSREDLKREMEGFHPALLRLADMATDVLPLWRCTTRDPLTQLHRGRMVVMGDAAHPVKPHMGLGAVSAIEDAGVLATLMKNIPATGDLDQHISERLKLFSELRVGRVAAYKYYSDVPFFLDAVQTQREKCEKFMKPEDLPGEQI